MIAPSTIASADSGSDPSLADLKPRPLPSILELDDLDRAVADVQSDQVPASSEEHFRVLAPAPEPRRLSGRIPS